MPTWINFLEIIYPIGSFYISNVNISPAEKIGGTWVQVTDAALRGATSSGYTGADTHSITTSEMPSHNHSGSTASAGAHTHALYYATNGTRSGSYWQAVTSGASHDGSSSAYLAGNAGSHSHSVTIGNKGDGSAMSLVQRSYNCYIWYRTA